MLDVATDKENGTGRSGKAPAVAVAAASPADAKQGRPPSSSGAAVTTPALSVTEMSGFFLEGPAVPARSGGGAGAGAGGSSQGGEAAERGWNLPSARYALPLGEIVVGRDSVRDANPANSNKLRIGIDKREEVGVGLFFLCCGTM